MGIECVIEKSALPMIKRNRKSGTTDEKKTTNSRSIRTLGEKENCKYLGLFKAHTIKQEEMKVKS